MRNFQIIYKIKNEYKKAILIYLLPTKWPLLNIMNYKLLIRIFKYFHYCYICKQKSVKLHLMLNSFCYKFSFFTSLIFCSMMNPEFSLLLRGRPCTYLTSQVVDCSSVCHRQISSPYGRQSETTLYQTLGETSNLQGILCCQINSSFTTCALFVNAISACI